MSDKLIPSTPEMDLICYGDEKDKNNGYYHTGWYVYMSSARRKQIARFLEIPSLYCIGIRNNDGRIFVQLSRKLDPRNNCVEYAEVKPEFVQKITEMTTALVDNTEQEMMIAEDVVNMDLARRGLL